MKKVLYGRYSKGTAKTITTTPPALAVNTYPTEAKSFELQGRSFVLNQQIYQMYNTVDPSLTGLTVTFNNGLLSVSGTADVTLNIKFLDNGDLVANHKYYFNAPAGSSASGYRPYFATSGDSYTTDSIITWTTGKGSFNIRVNGGTSTGFSYYPQFIDLTQIFGSGFEPTTVDQLKSVLDLDKYIPYNPGTFIHNNAIYEVNKWNQLAALNGGVAQYCSVSRSDGVTTVTPSTYTSDSVGLWGLQTGDIVVGHKYLLTVDINPDHNANFYFGVGGQSTTKALTSGSYQIISNIITATTAGSLTLYGQISSAGWTDGGFSYKNLMLIDLTDIFGAGKEPSTVDECKLRFLSMGIDITKYQPYSPLGGQYCGYRNIWDEEWEVGDFNATTGVKESGSRIINADYIPVLSNTNYYVNNTNVITVYYYDSNKTFLGYNNPSSGCFESLPNSAYINFRCSTTYGTTYKNDISIYQVSNKVDLGFNIWDEEWELGTIEQNGTMASSTTTIRTKNYIPASAQTVYYINTGKWRDIHCYNSSFQHLGTVPYSASGSGYTFTTLAGTAYLKVPFNTSYGTTYNHDICINLSQTNTTKSPHNGDYRPYLMLMGIGSDFNIWDETIESGEYNATTGEKQAAVDYLRSVNKTRVLPSTTYYLKCPLAVSAYYYDANGIKIGTNAPTLSANSTFTTVAGAYYMTFAFNKNNYGSTTYKNDICINLSQPQTTINPHNGQYVPHLFDTYDSMNGILTRRIKQVTFTGSGDGAKVGSSMTAWEDTYGATNSYGIRVFSLNYCDSKNGGAVLSGFGESYRDRNSQLSQEGMGVNTSGNTIFIAILASRLSTVSSAGFATWLQSNPLTMLYELNAYQVFTPIQYSGIDLGSLSWVYDSTYGNFYTTGLATTIKRPAASNIIPNVRCSKYSAATQNNYSTNNTIKVITNGQVWIKDTSYGTDASAFKAGMTGVMLTYQNNTPYKFGVVDMGSLNWTRVDVTGSGGYVFSTPATPLQMYKQSDNLWCSGYTTGHYTGTGSTIYNYGNKTIAQHTPSGEFNIYVRDDSYTSASDFKNAVKGKILTYELSDSISQTTITQPISFVSGKLGKQYGVVELSTLSWTWDSNNGVFYSSVVSDMKSSTKNLFCGKYKTNSTASYGSALQYGEMTSFSYQVYIKDAEYTNATALKNSLHGQYLIYELAQPITGTPTYATAGNLIQKTNGDVGDVDFNLVYNTLLSENKFLISYNMGTSQSPDKRLINVGGILNA